MKLMPSLIARARAMRVPAQTTIELLAPCNLKCVHCYVTHSKRNALSLEVLERLFDEMSAAGCFSVTLTGGEIALRKDLFDIVEAARRRYLAVGLLTSGTLWSEAHWDRVVDLGVAHVRLSVYAMDACTHEAVTLAPGSLEKTLATLRGLHARGVSVGIAAPIMSVNAHAVADVVRLANELDVPINVDAHITVTDRNDAAPKQTVASHEQLVSVFADPTVRARLFVREPGCAEPDDDERSCSVGQSSAFIQCTGEVYPCTNWPTSAGNVLERSFIDIFRESETFSFARSVRYRDQSGCKGCGDHGSCNRCIGMNLQENGDVAIPSTTVCAVTEARAEAFHGNSARRVSRRSLPIVG